MVNKNIDDLAVLERVCEFLNENFTKNKGYYSQICRGVWFFNPGELKGSNVEVYLEELGLVHGKKASSLSLVGLLNCIFGSSKSSIAYTSGGENFFQIVEPVFHDDDDHGGFVMDETPGNCPDRRRGNHEQTKDLIGFTDFKSRQSVSRPGEGPFKCKVVVNFPDSHGDILPPEWISTYAKKEPMSLCLHPCYPNWWDTGFPLWTKYPTKILGVDAGSESSISDTDLGSSE